MTPLMSQPRMRYWIGFVLIIAGLIYLGVTVFKSSLQYYVTVSELLASPGSYSHKVLKVAGKVKEGSVTKTDSPDGIAYQFVITDSGHEIPIYYKGLVPDTFKAGGDVVATGRLEGDQFMASNILAKCASKYEAKVK